MKYNFPKYSNEELRKGGVYTIHNIETKKIYIGSTITSFRERWTEHLTKLERNTHPNKRLQNEWNCLNRDSFKFIIEEVINENFVLSKEQYFIEKYRRILGDELLYNTCMKAGNTMGVKQTEETILLKSKKWVFVDPLNNIYEVINMRRFCRERNLPQSHMINIAHRKSNQYKGWLCYQYDQFDKSLLEHDRKRLQKPTYLLISPNGIEFRVTKLREFCRKNNLDHSSIINTAKNRKGRTQHKGWKAIRKKLI